MKALLTSIVLVSLITLIYPGISKADFSLQTVVNTQDAQFFQIKNSTVSQNDPLASLLSQYLDSHGSPLDEYASQIIQLPNWKRSLAISYVESHMGIYCLDNNCSGMGGAPGLKTWRKYTTKLDWFKDLDKLMSKPMYSEKYNTCAKMKGVYVQPGSASWVYGCEKVYSELTNLEEQASQLRLANQVNSNGQLALAK